MDREHAAADGPLLDLAAIGGRLVEDALVAAERGRLAAALAPILSQLPEASRGPAEAAAAVLTEHLARFGAGIEALRQELESARRSRETLLRIDPLVFAEPDRGGPAPPPKLRWETSVVGDGFVGFNWHHPERDDRIGWRWAGPGPVSTVRLPTLGGGRLRLTLTLLVPFGQPFAEDAVLAFLDYMPCLEWPVSAAEHYAKLRATQKKTGRLLGYMDTLIACHALAENLILVTNNERDFARIPGLTIENWAT